MDFNEAARKGVFVIFYEKFPTVFLYVFRWCFQRHARYWLEMPPHSKEKWLKIGYDLLKGLPCNAVAHKHRVSVGAILVAIERFPTLGHLHALAPKGGKGKIRRAQRITTQQDEDRIEASLLKLRPTPEETTCNRIAADTKLNKKLHNPNVDVVGLRGRKARRKLVERARKTINRRCNERGYFWEIPASKEDYTPQQRSKRKAFAIKYCKKTVAWWRKVVFTDEHDVVHATGHVAVRQVSSRKRKVPMKKGDFGKPGVTRPRRGGQTHGGTHRKMCAAILHRRIVLLEPTEKYIAKRKPPVPKVPKLSKNGKRVGRPPVTGKKAKREVIKKFDSPAYAVFIEELAETVRKILAVGPDVSLQGLQDGAKFHWGPEARKAATDAKISFFTDFPAYSPDLNPIENVFSILEQYLGKWAVRNNAKSVKATIARAQKLCDKTSDTDYIESMVESMPNRLAEVIKANGGPTRY